MAGLGRPTCSAWCSLLRGHLHIMSAAGLLAPQIGGIKVVLGHSGPALVPGGELRFNVYSEPSEMVRALLQR